MEEKNKLLSGNFIANVRKKVIGNERIPTKSYTIADFTNLSEKIPGIDFGNAIPLVGTNISHIFYNPYDLPDGITSVEEMDKKCVVYTIIVDNGKFYFGHTTDLSQRMITHAKDIRKGKKNLYKDIREYGRCFIRFELVCDDLVQAKKYESSLIKAAKEYALKNYLFGCGTGILDDKKTKEVTSESCYNILNS